MKIVISGTYSTGKTTLSLALSFLSGIPATRARTMREILPTAFPGYSLTQCGPEQLIELGMRRFTERIQAELKMNGTFISDGCPLQEWLYGSTRLKTGLNPAEDPEIVKAWIEKNPEMWRNFHETIEGFGKVAKEYTKKSYDAVVHLPIEFPFSPDGHRPTSESFRLESEQTLVNTYRELGIAPIIIRGTIQERLRSITERLCLKNVMSIDEALRLAIDYKKSHAVQVEKREVNAKELFMNTM